METHQMSRRPKLPKALYFPKYTNSPAQSSANLGNGTSLIRYQNLANITAEATDVCTLFGKALSLVMAHRPHAVETWAENNILSMAGIWCTFQMRRERVGPALCPQPEDVVVPRACWSTAWGLIVAGAILHTGTTVGRVGRAAPCEVNGASSARVIPSMYNVCGMMRENGWNECRCWSYHWLGSCSQWSVWRLNEALHSPFKKKDLIHLKCKVKHFKPNNTLSWLLIYQPTQKFREWITKNVACME